MSNYTKTTDFAAKDSLPTGDAGKIIRGAEFGTEFDNIATAIATKADTAGPTLTGTTTFDTLSDGTIGITAFVDEDDMSSDSATMLPTQQSVKAYVDSQTTAQDLDFEADTGGPLSIDLDSETLTFTGGTGIDTSGVDNAVTFAIDSTVTTLTDTQTLTNKTLTSADIDTPDIDGGTIDGTVIGGTTAAAVSATTISATGNITVDGTVDGRDVATDGTKLDNIEASADVTDTTNVTAAGALMDSEVTNLDQVKAFDTTDYATAAQGTTADAALPKTGGAMTGAITTNSTFDGRDVSVDGDKLDLIEANADVTDTTNVTAAGALMDSELTDITAVKSLDQGVATTDTPTFAGLTTTADVSFGDNDKAIFGTGNDLEVFHDGSHSYVRDSGTGHLKLQGTDVRIQSADGAENFLVADLDGAVRIYNDNAQKLQTTSTGIGVTGNATFADNGKAIFGTGSDMSLFHNGNNGFLDNDTGTLFIQTDSFSVKNATGTESLMLGTADGAVTLYHNNLAKLATTSTGIDVTGTVTADGLTVDGIAEISSTTPTLRFFETDQTDEGTLLRSAGDSFQIAKMLDTGAADGIRFAIDQSSGDISFYEDTGTTPALTWDASAQSLNVDGPITADGLTVDGNNDIQINRDGVSSAKIFWNRGVTQDAAIELDASESLTISVDDAGLTGKSLVLKNNSKVGFALADGGDISFYEDTGTTAKLFWDASAESLGIGDSNPNATLKVKGPVDTATLSTSSTPAARINNGGAISNWIGANGYNYGYIQSIQDDGTNNLKPLVLQPLGNNVGIGTSSPAKPLHVQDGSSGITAKAGTIALVEGSGNTKLTVASGTTSTGELLFGSSADNDAGRIIYDHSNDGLQVWTNGSRAVDVDSSGNLLVGTTETDVGYTDSGAGCMLAPEGTLQLARNSANELLYLNKLGGNDGDIIRLSTDGNEIGVIGVRANFIKIGNGDTHLLFNSSADAVTPEGATDNRDAAIDLGRSVSRFKDLYLSGGVYLGGTGSANHLDDYEEGTWTPTLSNGVGDLSATSLAFNASGRYTKIGRVVYITGVTSTSGSVTGTASSPVNITGLPFTVGGVSIFGGSFVDDSPSYNKPSVRTTSGEFGGGSTIITLKKDGTTHEANFLTSDLAASGNANRIYISGFYTIS